MEDYKKYLPMTLETRDSYDLWLKYDDEYLVSVTSHRVKALNYHKRGIVYELVPRIIVRKNSIGQNSYAYVSIHGEPKELHLVIIEAIHGKLQKGLEVDHINTDGTDNYLLNLRICTHFENMKNPLTVQHHAEAMSKLWETTEHREKHAEGCRKRSQDPEWQKNNAEGAKKRAADPEWQRKNSEAAKKRAEDPEWLKNTAEAAKRRAQDPEWQRKNAEKNKKLAQDPEWQKKNAEAREKMYQDPEWQRKNSEANRKRCCKPVDQFTLDGQFVKRWSSASDAARELGLHQSKISSCCRGKRHTAGGYIWRFAVCST